MLIRSLRELAARGDLIGRAMPPVALLSEAIDERGEFRELLSEERFDIKRLRPELPLLPPLVMDAFIARAS